MDEKANVLYFAVIAFSLGVLLRSFYQIEFAEVGLVVLVAFVLIFCGRGWGFAPPAPVLVSLGLLTLLVALGILRLEWASWSEVNPYLESHLGEELTFTGTVSREPDERALSTHLYVQTEYGLILVTIKKGGAWNYGDVVEVTGEVEQPESFETDLGRSFNYRGYLLAKGVSYIAPFAEVSRLREGEGNFILINILEAKHAFIEKIEQLIPEPEAGLSLGLLLGVKRALGEDLEMAFRRTGIIHIVVLSGYNIMIVVTFILYVLGRIFGQRLSAIFGILGIITFAVMVGLSATVVRASIMASLLLIMGLTGRVYLVLRGLFVAGALMILWNPYSLAYDVGFQLSFLATLGLITFSPYLQEKLEVIPTYIGVREFVTATLATQLFVLPLLLYQMGEFSVVAVLVNVLVLPMVAVAMLLSFITGVMAFLVPPFVSSMAFVAYLSLKYIVVIAETFSALPLAALSVPPFPFWMVLVGYAVITFMIWHLKQKPDPLEGWVIEERKF